MISIYVHIPFCIKKCAYCDFLSFPSDDETISRYVDCLCNEIEKSQVEDRDVYSVFFGGGTPSILDGNQINQIMLKIIGRFNLLPDCEITIECNPGTATLEKLSSFYNSGINRLSIGLQSSNDEELKNIGRIHNYNQFLETYKMARDVGFENINIDIMSALPGQSIESYRDTLTKVVTLKPEHVSAYSLIIEEGTDFWGIYGDDACVSKTVTNIPKLPDEDAERAMYYMTKEVLDQFGYHRYEISNYALEGYECKHNKVYWTGGEYVAFGIGASSYMKGVRYNNISSVTEYMDIWGTSYGMSELDERCVSEYDDTDATADGAHNLHGSAHTDINVLSKKDRMEEYMFVGLRLMEGVSINRWKELFSCDINEVYGEVITSYVKRGMLAVDGDRIRLTDRGIDVSNVVLADFLLD